MKFGAHMSIAGGIDNAPVRGKKIGCDTIQIFTKNANQWKAKEISKEEILRFEESRKKTGIFPVVAHNSYLINIASPDDTLYKKSIDALFAEIKQAERLSLPYLIIHPGSHTGSGEGTGLQRIADALNSLHEKTEGFTVKILLETTAGQGTSLGHTFEQLATIIDRVTKKESLGLCLDTSHLFVAGYNIRTKKGYEETMKNLHDVIGIERVKIIHINDSKKPLGSRVDRHEHIGKGYIGKEGFRPLLKDKRFFHVPMILETPKKKDEEDIVNLKILRRLAKS
jgi:deoxyribonuclease-4